MKKDKKQPQYEEIVIYRDNIDGKYKIKYADGTVDIINKAHNLSPLDNRYRHRIPEIAELFSDFNMTRAKVMVEVTYFKHLYINKVAGFKGVKESIVNTIDIDDIDHIFTQFTDDDYRTIQAIERETDHDIKAIEYFVRSKLANYGIKKKWLEYVHFGLTSQDVVSLAYTKVIRTCVEILASKIISFMKNLNEFSKKHNKVIMVARTHGQPAIPTSVGREMTIFVYRMQQMLDKISNTELKCKFGGAIGNMAAHYDAFPDVNWENVLNKFVDTMGVQRTYVTTQTDNYDSLCTIFDHMRGISNIMIDLCKDMWTYISMNYFKINVGKNTVGSSTMPQKVNPIYFENAEGNLEISVMWFNFLSNKLRISRLQRDLTDSTVIRNVGIPFGHFQLSIDSMTRAFSILEVNKSIIKKELDNSYFILAESIQTRLRKEGYTSAYEKIKEHFRGIISMNRKQFHEVISAIDGIPYEFREKLFDMKPEDYYRS